MYAMQMEYKKLVFRRKSELKVSWGVCDFKNYLTRSFSYGLCPLVKLLLGFSWIEKGGLFLNVELFMEPQYSEQNQSMATTKRLLCGKLQWWTLPRDGHIFVHTFSVGLNLFLLWMGGGGGGERSEHVPRVVYETLKYWKLLNSLLQIRIVANAYGSPLLYDD